MSISPSYVDGLELRIKELGEQVAILTKERDIKEHCITQFEFEDLRMKEQLAEQNEKQRKFLEFLEHTMNRPNLASPVLNRIRAEGMREAAKFVETQRNDIPACGFEFAAAIRARADELTKGNK